MKSRGERSLGDRNMRKEVGGVGCGLLLGLMRRGFDSRERGGVRLRAMKRSLVDEGRVEREGGRCLIGVMRV